MSRTIDVSCPTCGACSEAPRDHGLLSAPTTTDLDKLEALAKAATPGPWREGAVEKHHVFVANRHPEALGPERVLLKMNVRWSHEDDAKYIAATSPDVVLALIAEMRRLRGGA